MKKLCAVIFSAIFIINSISVFAATPQPSTIMMTVVLKDGANLSTVKANLEKKGAKIIKEFNELGAIEVKGSANLIPSLVKDTSIQSVSPSMIQKLQISKFDSADLSTQNSSNVEGNYYDKQWDVKQVTNNWASMEIERGNHNTVVGIIDSGVSINHPDLVANLMPGGKNYVPQYGVNGDDTTETGNINDINDRNGHGSHLAGSIAGKGLILGVAPDIGYRPYRIFGKEGSTYTYIIASAIIGAVKDGVDVINLSLGGYDIKGNLTWTDPNTNIKYNLGNDVADSLLYKKVIQYADSHGVTVVVAAGNESLNLANKSIATDYLNNEYGKYGYNFSGATFEMPGSLPNVITVSATGPDCSLASYSNYGSGCISVAAPGGDFKRYPNSGYYTDMCFGSYLGSKYVWMAGTSMAAPKVSAVAGLIISKYGKIGPNKVSEIIYKSSVSLQNPVVDEYFGHGMVNAYNALK